MTRLAIGVLGVVLAGASVSAGFGMQDIWSWRPRPDVSRFFNRPRAFDRIATFANYRNNPTPASETVSEIVAATQDGRTLIYTDAVGGAVGFIDIGNPSSPQAGGRLTLPSGHEPTSVDTRGNTFALVAVDSSESFIDPSGYLAVVDLATRTVVREIDLGGQPDSIKVSDDGRYAAVAIENQRDEDVNDGELPQAPAGYLAVIALTGDDPDGWIRADVGLTGLASYGADDPEPEFVDINSRNEAVVSLQENNHIVIVDLATRQILRHFPAGAVTLTGVDATEDGVIALNETLPDVPREPDAVAWVPGPGGRLHVATANEGDLFGGSRGFTLFRTNGTVAFDSGSSFETLAVEHGHYPEDRSENKGAEPEAIEYARFGSTDYLFVASERGSFVAVYTLDRSSRPVFQQLLPAPLSPEGLLAIPERDLLVVSGEVDEPSFGVRSTVMIYRLRPGPPAYPQIVSATDDEQRVPWSALSGMVALPGEWHSLLGVWDSFYSESRIFKIDVSGRPAVITSAITVTGGRGNFDPEGIAVGPDGAIWIASEGNASDSRQNLLVRVNRHGVVQEEVSLPADVLACRAATTKRATLGSGFEGVAVLPGGRQHYRLIVAQQRGWDYTTPACEALDDDAGGFNAAGEPNFTRLWIYDPADGTWSHVAWELAAKPAVASWVGLSEITQTPSRDYFVIERDNRTGDFGELKTIVRFDWPGAVADGIVRQTEKATADLRPLLLRTNGWITDKPEGVAITPDGRTFVVTDNDGVDDWSGETWFLHLGPYWRLFR